MTSADINAQTNRFTSGVTYDAAGQITVDGKFRGRQYQYDAQGRMKWSAYTDGTGVATSVYDGLGQRVQTSVGGVTRQHVYDAFGRVVAEYVISGAPQTGSTYKASYAMYDRQGSKRVVMSESGAVVARHDYYPFGEEIQAGTGMRTTAQGYGASDNVRQRYAATERDEGSGLEHTPWRKLETLSGRWTSPDPYQKSIKMDDPQTFNRYSYVGNDPLNSTDPSGLLPPGPGTRWGGDGFATWGWQGGGYFFQTPWGYNGWWFADASVGFGWDIGWHWWGPDPADYDPPQRPRDPTKLQGERLRLFKEAYDLALALLELNEDCSNNIRGNSNLDPATELKGLFEKNRIRYGGSGIRPDGKRDTAYSVPPQGRGSNGAIFLYDSFFEPSVGGYRSGYDPRSTNWGLSEEGARALVLLHELRHAVSGVQHDGRAINSSQVFNENILIECFGLKL